MNQLVDRFIRYAKIDTQSDEQSTTCPSTNKQFNLAKVLKDELEQMDFIKTELDENLYLETSVGNVRIAVMHKHVTNGLKGK